VGILVLLAITTCMLGAFAAFFIYLKRRMDAAARQDAHGGSY